MIDLLITPGSPGFLTALCGALLMGWSLRLRRTTLSVPARRTDGHQPLSWLTGQLAGGALATLIALPAVATGATGTSLLLYGMAALAAYMLLGWTLPRRAQVAAARRARTLRKLTPGFVAYVRVSLAGFDTPAVILERYAARPDARSAPMGALARAALDDMQRRRLRPFSALRDQARLSGCRELIDVAETLAQAENEGADVGVALAQHEQTLLAVLDDEFRRMLKRRTMYLLLLVALAVVVGILGNLLYVMLGSVFLGGAA